MKFTKGQIELVKGRFTGTFKTSWQASFCGESLCFGSSKRCAEYCATLLLLDRIFSAESLKFGPSANGGFVVYLDNFDITPFSSSNDLLKSLGIIPCNSVIGKDNAIVFI